MNGDAAPPLIDQLYAHYAQVNEEKFGGLLPAGYRIAFNPLLRRLTGRITYGQRLIEIASFHVREYGYGDAIATLEHELLHLYLHTLGKPSGHTLLFKQLAHQLGIRVFHANPYPRNRPPRHRWVYECPECGRLVFRQRRSDHHAIACGVCCRLRNDGVWDARFTLRLLQKVRFG